MHCAIKVTRKTIAYITSLNNDIPLDEECLAETCYFVWGDNLEEPRVYTARDYHNIYKQTVVVPIRVVEERVTQAEKLAKVLSLVEAEQETEDEESEFGEGEAL